MRVPRSRRVIMMRSTVVVLRNRLGGQFGKPLLSRRQFTQTAA